MKEYFLTDEFVELVKLLKILGIAETGGHAKNLVTQGEVVLNGCPEFRKKAKLREGDEVEVHGEKIKIRIKPS